MNWEALTDWRQLLVWPGPDTETALWVTQVFAVVLCLSLIHIPSPRDATLSRMPSSA